MRITARSLHKRLYLGTLHVWLADWFIDQHNSSRVAPFTNMD